MKISKVLFLVFICVFLLGCSAQITQQQAEENALNFVKGKVKFYAKSNETAVGVSDYKFDKVSSYREDDKWIVVMHITGTAENQTKKNDITIKLDDKGNVVEFNGQPVK